jgi:hypothetical protein
MAQPAFVLDCQRLKDPRLAEIDQIARLRLAAQCRGCELELRNASEALLELIAFAGLADVLGVEVQGQSEEGEQPRGVEEEGQLGDSPV